MLKTFFEKEASEEERSRFFNYIIPTIQKLCLLGMNHFPEPPRLLKKHSNEAVYLTQYQCGILLGSVQTLRQLNLTIIPTYYIYYYYDTLSITSSFELKSAMSFFCLFPRRNSNICNPEYASFNTINFNKLFGLQPAPYNFEKLRTLLNYFNRLSNLNKNITDNGIGKFQTSIWFRKSIGKRNLSIIVYNL